MDQCTSSRHWLGSEVAVTHGAERQVAMLLTHQAGLGKSLQDLSPYQTTDCWHAMVWRYELQVQASCQHAAWPALMSLTY